MKISKINFIFYFFFILYASFFLINKNYDYINNDGLLYISQTHYFLDNLHEYAISLNNLYIYPLIVAKFINIFGLSIIDSYYFFNVLFTTLSFYFFSKIIFLIANNNVDKKNILLFAIFLIFILNISLFGKYLIMILRDHPFWFFLISGFYFLINFIKTSNIINFIIYNILFFLGCFFRPEILVYHLFSFLFLVKIRKKLHSGTIIFLIFLVLIILTFLVGYQKNYLSNLIDLYFYHFNSLFRYLPIESNNMWLQDTINSYNVMFYFIFPIILIYKSVLIYGPLNLFLITFIKKYIKYIDLNYSYLILFFILIALLIPLINFISTFVISARYIYPLILFSDIILVFGIYEIIVNRNKYNVYVKILFLVLLLFNFITIYLKSPKTNHEKDASTWLIENNLHQSKFYSNSEKFNYHLNLFKDKNISPEDALKDNYYEFLIIVFNKFYKYREYDNYVPEKFFPNQLEPKVVIFKKVNLE